jgi:serine/threonine protein kinase
MASIWQIFGRGTASPTISEFLHLSNTNIQRINYLTSHDQSHTEEPLNLSQCQSLSSKLVRVLENIAGLFYFWDQDSTSATLPIAALENFYLVSERAKELVESCCCSDDWCKASTFQIQNEEAFKDILLETSLCYNTIYDLVKYKVPYQDLRQTSTFEPPTSAEVVQDRMALVQRYQKFVDNLYNSDALIRKQHLAMYLLRRLKYVASQSSIDDFDMTTENSWPYGRNPGDEWGKNSEFLGGNVCKTTWLDVPCAKKVFEDGVREEEILLEARIMACLNHPNIVKFICWGHETENAWCHFIAMEQMERGLHSLIRKQAQLRKGPPFPLLSAMDIMLQIAYGMCYLHDNGVAHRDLKTCNVVVCQITTPHLQDYVHVKLIDFGLSKVKLSASRSNTISRPRIGTTVYMAPEAFQHGRANWFKVDVYSFGIMCSVILSGKEPFSSVEFQRSKVYEAICTGERPMLPPETPEDLACLIKECWDTDRNVRPNFLDICTRLAKLRHKLLKDDPHDHCSKNETDIFASLYIQNMIKKRSDAQKQDCKQLLKNVTEEDEWFDPDQVRLGQNKKFFYSQVLSVWIFLLV